MDSWRTTYLFKFLAIHPREISLSLANILMANGFIVKYDNLIP